MDFQLPHNCSFTRMQNSDVDSVLRLIDGHNPDDAEEAEETYEESLQDQFVLRNDDSLIGVTGFSEVDGTDGTYWLSWTYLSPDAPFQLIRNGCLFHLVCEQLLERDARKLFAMISPYVDGPIGSGHASGGAESSYLSFGFQVETNHADYYSQGEPQTIFGYRISPWEEAAVEPDDRSIQFIDADRVEETDEAYFFDWQFRDSNSSQDSTAVFESEFERWMTEIRSWGIRVAFIGVPSVCQLAIRQLNRVGFRDDGRLHDFYVDGIDEVRLRIDL